MMFLMYNPDYLKRKKIIPGYRDTDTYDDIFGCMLSFIAGGMFSLANVLLKKGGKVSGETNAFCIFFVSLFLSPIY
jgi:hypothetical protein